MRILAFDPGGSTGICEWRSDMGVTMQDQIIEADHHDLLWNLLDLVQPDTIVYETFTYIPNLADANLIAREYIGVIKLWWQRIKWQCNVVPQSPNYGKAFWSDDKLKKARLYKPGLPHAMDATRHMLAYTAFHLMDDTYIRMLK